MVRYKIKLARRSLPSRKTWNKRSLGAKKGFNMKIFLDSSDYEKIKYWKELGVLDGITTNPTTLARSGGNPTENVRNICALMEDYDVSVEVTESDPHKIYEQAHQLADLADNVVVKIPCYRDYYPVIEQLGSEGIGVNVTLVFSIPQALFVCKLGAKYISPFIGRLEDVQQDGVGLIYDLRDMVDEYEFTTEVLAASIRTVDHLSAAIKAGAHVATLPESVLEKATEHPLTDKGMKQFLDDWDKLKASLLPCLCA